MMKKYCERIFVGFIFFLLYAPIVTLVVLSFNDSKTRAKWGGFTLKWYKELFQNEAIMGALYNTLLLALLSATIATIIGTLACIGMNSMRKKQRSVIIGITNIPMLNAEIVTGISLMLLFMKLSDMGIKFLELGFITILIGHITFNLPFVILSVLPRFKQTSNITYEAARDLGATPTYAFFKVVFPDIFPGVLSGFLLAFTMSLDDFIITYFVKGAGIDTLSTKIYSEVRKGIKPEMYALSTILFLSVLILLYGINKRPAKKTMMSSNTFKKRVIAAIVCFTLMVGGVAYLGISLSETKDKSITVYNWGEYMDPDVIDLFEEETGISVIYEEFETNEIMYPKLKAGGVSYDVVCPSDYMIQRMINEDMLAPLNFDNIPNYKYIGKSYLESAKQFDPENKYSVPYCWGTVGILYNKTMVSEPVTSWSILWDEKYKNNILMQDSVRDSLGITLKLLGYSLNSTNKEELEEAKNLLLEQKPLVQAYVIDQVRDKMIGNEAALGIIYSGEAIYTQRENSDLEYVVPDEGSNLWIDSWVIPKTAKNKEGAEAFLDFICRPDIAKMNFDYITYSTPNEGAKALSDKELQENQIAFPDDSILKRCETFSFLGDEMDAYYIDLWKQIKSK